MTYEESLANTNLEIARIHKIAFGVMEQIVRVPHDGLAHCGYKTHEEYFRDTIRRYQRRIGTLVHMHEEAFPALRVESNTGLMQRGCVDIQTKSCGFKASHGVAGGLVGVRVPETLSIALRALKRLWLEFV